MRKPFFWKARKCWYVRNQQGLNVRLDPVEEKAFAMWERMRSITDYKHPDATIEAIFEGFLAFFELKASRARYDKAITLLSSFADHFGPTRRIRDVTCQDLEKWLNMKRQRGKKEYTWSIARKRDGAQFVLRAYRWAHVQGWIPASDILLHRSETPEPRIVLVDRATHERCVKATRTGRRNRRPFGLVLIALWHSGVRPIQVRELTTRHINRHGDWVFDRHKTGKKTGRKLIVRPSACLKTLVAILSHSRPTGPLFRSPTGEAWTKDGLVRRFNRMRTELGLDSSLVMYAYRHTFATEALLHGASMPTVAALLGHKDSTMVAKVYSHLDVCDDPMRAEALRIASERTRR
ncbi:MAG: tyrosine-type recombinase/integrase [Pirellula sp.]|jgi:integrase